MTEKINLNYHVVCACVLGNLPPTNATTLPSGCPMHHNCLEDLVGLPSADKNWAEKIAIAKEAREAGKILRGQPSAAAELATRLPVSMYEMLRAEGLSDERAWVYLDLLRSEKSDHAQESQPAPAGQAEPCAHPAVFQVWENGKASDQPRKIGEFERVGSRIECVRCGERLVLRWVPAQARGGR